VAALFLQQAPAAEVEAAYQGVIESYRDRYQSETELFMPVDTGSNGGVRIAFGKIPESALVNAATLIDWLRQNHYRFGLHKKCQREWPVIAISRPKDSRVSVVTYRLYCRRCNKSVQAMTPSKNYAY